MYILYVDIHVHIMAIYIYILYLYFQLCKIIPIYDYVIGYIISMIKTHLENAKGYPGLPHSHPPEQTSKADVWADVM